jgi:hypothetical protein
MNALQRLQDWYLAQCNGDWEHAFGVAISTLDNPGWTFEVELTDTRLSNKPFATLGRDSDDPQEWIHCSIRDGKFVGACGPRKLEEVIEIFLTWAEES